MTGNKDGKDRRDTKFGNGPEIDHFTGIGPYAPGKAGNAYNEK